MSLCIYYGNPKNGDISLMDEQQIAAVVRESVWNILPEEDKLELALIELRNSDSFIRIALTKNPCLEEINKHVSGRGDLSDNAKNAILNLIEDSNLVNLFFTLRCETIKDRSIT